LLPKEVGAAPVPKVKTSIPVPVTRTATVPVVSTPTPVDERPPLADPAEVSVVPARAKVCTPLFEPRTTVLTLLATDTPGPDRVAAAVVEASVNVEPGFIVNT